MICESVDVRKKGQRKRRKERGKMKGGKEVTSEKRERTKREFLESIRIFGLSSKQTPVRDESKYDSFRGTLFLSCLTTYARIISLSFYIHFISELLNPGIQYFVKKSYYEIPYIILYFC